MYIDNVIEVDEKDINKYQYDKVLPTEVKVYEQEVVKENKRTVQNIIEKIVDVPVERVIERNVERIIDRPVERIVERPVYVDNIIE